MVSFALSRWERFLHGEVGLKQSVVEEIVETHCSGVVVCINVDGASHRSTSVHRSRNSRCSERKVESQGFPLEASWAGAFPRGSLLPRLGRRRRRSYGWGADHGSCRKTCATVSKTWLCISLPFPPRTRPFSRPRRVYAKHLATRRNSERERSPPAFTVRTGYHGSSR